ncbi:low specificity L-threonine aldolase [Zavarzinia sp.]|uniref:threonine aldolase family protein n=1 Tax=Zavarzinia sp. TaxID=2027920 RepID=UPI0035655D62
MNFSSDNVTGAHPKIVEALAEAAAAGPMPPYGADPISERLNSRLAELFEHEVTVFPVATGTAANALSLSALCPPWGGVLCAAEAHIDADECGAVEAIGGGTRLMTIETPDGRLTPEALARRLAPIRRGDQHQVQPAAVSITQATETGTVYAPDAVAALGAFCQAEKLRLHMDGARFGNAVVSLGCTPAEVTWKAGVDVLSFGATKNGALAAEAIIFFDAALAENFLFRRKRAGHLFSKMRFLSAQLDAYVADGLWLANAAHANEQAKRLALGLIDLPGVDLEQAVEANEIFVRLPMGVAGALYAAGFHFYPWGAPPEGDAPGLFRLVTAFDTDPAAVDALIATARKATEENT